MDVQITMERKVYAPAFLLHTWISSKDVILHHTIRSRNDWFGKTNRVSLTVLHTDP